MRSPGYGLVDRAEVRGLVRRDASPDDGRGVRVSMTAEGRALARIVEARVREHVADLAGVLSAGEQRRLPTLVTRLVSPAADI
jgi:MarR family transcriptional regulator, lower aerobic nicotinate degradation pathway regulator